jgi:hypothetical protein
MTDYDLKKWAADTGDGRRVFNAGFRMLPGDLVDWELVKAIPFEVSRGEGEFVYMLQRGGGLELLRVWVAELADWRSAQQRLLEDLRMSMRPDIPRATGSLGYLGDVAYAGRSAESDIPSSISFARGNICASVRSVGDREADASAAALWLDEALGRPPGRSAERGTRRVTDRRREEVRPRRAGDESTVVKNVTDVARGAWLQAIADVGELRRRDDALVYVATELQAARIELYTYEGGPEGSGRRPQARPRRKRTR